MRRKAAGLGALGAAVCWLSLVVSASAYDVMCRDGTISHAGGRQGACSHHGGVADGSGGTTPTPYKPPAPYVPPAPVAPADIAAPVVSSQVYDGPSRVATGTVVKAPAVTVSDDVAWPFSVVGYSLLLNWGDGLSEDVAFPGISTPYVSVSISLPTHVYVSPGDFNASVTVTDPAENSTTREVLAVAVEPAIAGEDGYPRLVGPARVGRILRCVPGDWGDAAARIRFRWIRSGKLLPTRTSSTLRLGRADEGRRIACRVNVRNDVASETATSRSRLVPRRMVHGRQRARRR